MKYLSEIEKSTKTLTMSGYRNKSNKGLNRLKHSDINYIMTADVFRHYAWLVGMTQWRRFRTLSDFNYVDVRVSPSYKEFTKGSKTLLKEFKLSKDRLLVEDPLDVKEFKKEQQVINRYLKENSSVIHVYGDGLNSNERVISYVVMGKDGLPYSFNGYLGLLSLIKDKVI
jgi:hypothetical protein